MGVILRQGFKHSIVIGLATVFGAINSLFIYTSVLSEKELGLLKYYLSIAQLVSPLLLLGLTAVAVKFYPQFKQEKKGEGSLFFFLGIISLISFCLFFLLCFTFNESIYEYYSNREDSALIIEYLPYVIALVFGLMFGNILAKYISNFKLIVVPEIFNNLWIKVAVPISGILYYFNYFTFHQFFLSISIAYVLPFFALLIYLWWIDELKFNPNIKVFTKPLMKDICIYGAYSLLGGLGTLIATQIDIIMVGELINMDNAGIYSIALFIATVIGIPLKSIFNITSPIIAESMAKNDLGNVRKLYSKTAINLLVIGVFLLIGIWVSIDLLFEIIPNGEVYKAGKYVVLVLGLAKIIDMATSINMHIIIYSEQFRFNFYLSLTLAILNIIFNLLFIPMYGLIGVAFATFTSMLIFNLIKYLFVLIKFNMQPFTYNMLWVVLVGVIAFLAAYWMPKTGNPFIDIILNSVIITLIYIPSILYFNLSEDLTKLKQQLIGKFNNLF